MSRQTRRYDGQVCVVGRGGKRHFAGHGIVLLKVEECLKIDPEVS
jgi:hypothetical protein